MNRGCLNMTKKGVKKISATEYLFKIFIDRETVGKLRAIARKDLDFGLFSFKLDRRYWVIEEIEIIPELRGQGLGSELMDFSLKYLPKKQELPFLVVPAKTESVSKLIAWYKKMGFVQHENGYLVKQY